MRTRPTNLSPEESPEYDCNVHSSAYIPSIDIHMDNVIFNDDGDGDVTTPAYVTDDAV